MLAAFLDIALVKADGDGECGVERGHRCRFLAASQFHCGHTLQERYAFPGDVPAHGRDVGVGLHQRAAGIGDRFARRQQAHERIGARPVAGGGGGDGLP